MKEIWKDIKGYEGYYQVSNLGRVRGIQRTVVRKNGIKQTIPSRILSSVLRSEGNYLSVHLSLEGDTKLIAVHRLMAQAFIPNPENKPQVNHKNGIKTDNNLSNLEWATGRENMKHAFRTGLKSNKGENSSRAILSRIDVLDIRAVYNQGWFSRKELANAYNVSNDVIRSVVTRRTWKHL